MMVPLLSIIPKKLGSPKHPADIRISPQLLEVGVSDAEAALQKLQTSREGLTEKEAKAETERAWTQCGGPG